MNNTPRVFGIGLNKTATKSLGMCFEAMGFKNRTYSLQAFKLYQKKDWTALFEFIDQHDSFEDWPWPLMYKEIDARYPDAKFILTTRVTEDIWYKSLCKMAVRMGPMRDFEKPIYGYSMPHGHRQEHIDIYRKHNADVRAYFSDRPGKLLEICFDQGFHMNTLTDFLGEPEIDFKPPHANKSQPVYEGDSLPWAHAHRIVFQTRWYTKKWARAAARRTIRLFR